MILKIQQKNGWVIYDNFEKIRYEHYKLENVPTWDVNAIWCEKQKGKETVCVHIIARKNITSNELLEFSILADTKVYICNNEGKTIERIN